MQTHRSPWPGRIAAMALWAVATAAAAADPVTDAMVAAYAPYRAALFQTNAGAPEASVAALQQAHSAWRELMARQAGAPAAPYDRDPGFAQSLQAVERIYAAAGEQVRRGQLAEAHETLEEVRDVLAALRQRNGVVVYSDHMNAYHAVMEHVLTEGKVLAAAPGGLLPLAEQVGVLDYLAARLASEAPAALREQAEFVSLLQAVTTSVARLREAVRAQQPAAAAAAIGQLKAPYGKLFLRYG